VIHYKDPVNGAYRTKHSEAYKTSAPPAVPRKLSDLHPVYFAKPAGKQGGAQQQYASAREQWLKTLVEQLGLLTGGEKNALQAYISGAGR